MLLSCKHAADVVFIFFLNFSRVVLFEITFFIKMTSSDIVNQTTGLRCCAGAEDDGGF